MRAPIAVNLVLGPANMIKTLSGIGTLKSRLTVVVIFLVLVATALVAFVSLQLGEQKMRAVVGDQQFALLSSAASNFDQDLASKKALMTAMAEHLALGDFSGPLAIQRFLEAHASLREEFFNVIALDDSGNLIGNLNDRRAIGKSNFSKRDYFIDTMRDRDGRISAPFQSALSKQPVVVVTAPVVDPSGKIRFI